MVERSRFQTFAARLLPGTAPVSASAWSWVRERQGRERASAWPMAARVRLAARRRRAAGEQVCLRRSIVQAALADRIRVEQTIEGAILAGERPTRGGGRSRCRWMAARPTTSWSEAPATTSSTAGEGNDLLIGGPAQDVSTEAQATTY